MLQYDIVFGWRNFDKAFNQKKYHESRQEFLLIYLLYGYDKPNDQFRIGNSQPLKHN